MQLKDFLKLEAERSVRKSYLQRSSQKVVSFVTRLVEKDRVFYGVKSFSKRGVTHNVVIGGSKKNTKVYCSCQSFLYQGFAYRNHVNNSGYVRVSTPDRHWRRYHGGALLCKHLLFVLRAEEKNLSKYLP